MTTLRAVAEAGSPPVADESGAVARPQPPGKLMHPSILPFFVFVAFLGTLSYILYQPGNGFMNWFTLVIWTIPIVPTTVGFIGYYHSRKWVQPLRAQAPISDKLIVVIPTIGRNDTYPSLEHVVESFVRELSNGFSDYRIDIIIEEDCEAYSAIRLLEVVHENVRVVEVPVNYQTTNGTKFKGRANQYALERRTEQGENTDSVWILHMDDDTAARTDTIRGVAKFISKNRNPENGLHLGQGVLTYDLNRSPNAWVWMADAIRPMDDMTRFAATTGTGTPYAGMHGELMLVRASVEEELSWDYGPEELVEDSRFATEFGVKYPGKTGWFPARCYGSSPETVRDYIKQRSRWAQGILGLALNREIPLKNRWLMLYGGIWWSISLIGHAFPVIAIGTVIFHDPNMSPAYGPMAGFWVINMSKVMWDHWEGLKINSVASGLKQPKLWHRLMIIPSPYVFAAWDGWSGLKGMCRRIKAKALKEELTFDVISKRH